MTNIYGPSNISIQTGKEVRKKSEKETQLVEEIKHTLLEQDLGYQTDNKKNEVNVIFHIGNIKYIIKKVKENEAPKGLVLIMQMVIAYIRSLVVEILGPKLEKLTPYFIYLFSTQD